MNRSDIQKFFTEHRKEISLFRIFLALGVIIALCIVFGYGQIMKWNYEKQAIKTDINYTKQYEEIIKPEGAKKINEILFEVSKIDIPQEKLNAIAKWETQNFTSFYWGHAFTGTDDLSRYYTYDDGKIRAFVGKYGINALYRDDPYWIAYQMAGECEEKAVLFEEVASRAGFITRVVGYPDQHAWVEVKDNNTWWYFDPDSYHYYIGDKLNETKWYNRTQFYRLYNLNFDNNVVVMKTGEDISHAYNIPSEKQETNQKKSGLPNIKSSLL